MKKNENGFSLLEVLVVVVVLGLIGGAGWLVYDRQNDKNSQSQNTDRQDTQTVPPAQETVKYTFEAINFSHPSSWKTQDVTSSLDSTEQETIAKSTVFLDKASQLGSIFTLKKSEGYASVLQEAKNNDSIEGVSETVINGLKVISYTTYGTSDKNPNNRSSLHTIFVDEAEYRLAFNPSLVDSSSIDSLVKTIKKN